MKTLKMKMLILLIPTTFTLFSIAFGILGSVTGSVLKQYAVNAAQQYAREGAREIEEKFEKSAVLLEKTVLFIQAQKALENTDRESLPALFKSLAESEPSIFSLWVLFEPDGWDGRDAEFANTGDYDELGNYSVWAYREQGSREVEVSLEAWGADAYEEDYYTGPRTKGQLWIGDPYEEEVSDGYSVPMITMALPVKDGSGRTIGVTGIDFAIDFLQNTLETIDGKSGGTSSLVSASGQFLADTFRDGTGQMLSDIHSPEISAIVEAFPGETVPEGKILETEDEAVRNSLLLEPVIFSQELPRWTYILYLSRQQIMAIPMKIFTALLIAEASMLVGLSLLILLVANRFTRPLTSLAETIRIVTTGDMRPEVRISGRDETANLAAGLNQLTETFSTLLQKVKGAMDQLNLNAAELTDQMDHTESRFSDTSLALKEMLSRGEDINRGLKTSSESLEKISSSTTRLEFLSREQSENILQSVAAIEQMLASISSVTNTVIQASSHYSRLNDSSARGENLLNQVIEQVEDIFNQSESLLDTNTVIANIASQTNLLAMNAAIEAAHAGAAGKGFAVVADEIRKLSEGTGTQSRAVEQILKNIVNIIRTITETSRQAGEQFGEVQNLIGTITRLEEEVKISMQEQSTGSQEILTALEKIKQASAQVNSQAGEVLKLVTDITGEVQTLNRNSDGIQASITHIHDNNHSIQEAVRLSVEVTRENKTQVQDLVKNLEIFRPKDSGKPAGV